MSQSNQYYRDDEVYWNTDDTLWSRADNLVGTGPTLEVCCAATVRVPSECRKQGGVKTYKIQDDIELTKKITESAIKAMQPITAVTEGDDDWSPELGRGTRVVEEWISQGFGLAIAKEKVCHNKWKGMTDGSKVGQLGTYGWILVGMMVWHCSSGKVMSHTRDMDSYRAELHGLMSLMAGAWTVIDPDDEIDAYCDNESVWKGFMKIKRWMEGGMLGETPKFNHSVDLWDEVVYWCKKWKMRFSLNWTRGHPETRDPTRLTWTFTDWMNHVADRLADAEYRCSGGVDEPNCLRNQSRWRVMFEGHRVTSMTLEALDDIQETNLTRPMAEEQNINLDAWDRKATKVVTGYSRILALRVKNVKYGWDKLYLNANKVRWHQHYRNVRSSGMEYDMSDKDTWCKLCNNNAVEDGRHFLCGCPNVFYKNIRRNWYAGVKKKIQGMSAGMKEALDRVLVNVDGCILNSLPDPGSERVLSAWDAVAGRIPILWTESAVKDGVEEGELVDFWSWYGRWLRKELWGKMWMVRSRELAKMATA